MRQRSANKNRRLNSGDFGELFAPPLLRLNKSRAVNTTFARSALVGAVAMPTRSAPASAARFASSCCARRLQFDKLNVVEVAVA